MPFIAMHQGRFGSGLSNRQNLFKILHLFQFIQDILMTSHYFFHRAFDYFVFNWCDHRYRLQSLRLADEAPDRQIHQAGQRNARIFSPTIE